MQTRAGGHCSCMTAHARRGVLPIAIAALANGARGLILPRDNELEAAVVEGLALYPVETLEDVAVLLRGERVPETRSVDPQSLFWQGAEHGEDLRDVKGQEQVKRTLEIAAAGNHHLLILCPFNPNQPFPIFSRQTLHQHTKIRQTVFYRPFHIQFIFEISIHCCYI